MKKIFFILLFLSSYVFAQESLKAKKANVLFVHKLIQKEEALAKEVENYILTHYKIPLLTNIIKDDNSFLDTYFEDKNFNKDNRFSDDKRRDYYVKNLQLRQYGMKNTDKKYMRQLYNRDLYRDRTSVYYDKNNIDNSYTQILLKSPEAKNIHNILKTPNTSIKKTCPPAGNTGYCIEDKNIRYYIRASTWIEYDIKLFNKGNVSAMSSNNNIDDFAEKLKDLRIGSYIFLHNYEEQSKITKYIKTITGFIKVE